MKKIGTALCILSVAFFVWLFASWGEIICKNGDEHPQYSKWNLFINYLEEVSENE